MKRLMSVLLIAIFFSACSSDDTNSGTTLVGSWKLVELNAAIPLDLNNDGTANRNVIEEIPCIKGNATFTADGNYLSTLCKVDEEEVDGTIVFNCNGDIVGSRTYELNGNQLTLTPDAPESETSTTIIDLNSNTISITISAGDFGTLEFVADRN
ncbi:lipocalin family protein [Aequorivita capsosiphonis]|uniref:lipocalin family protein n=1 Tax=Aequorivita capsosiphonis TaxID=487317 RepID=UPI00047A0693|nr:lipocalin family protein [Aequorivita capsosiphonis]